MEVMRSCPRFLEKILLSNPKRFTNGTNAIIQWYHTRAVVHQVLPGMSTRWRSLHTSQRNCFFKDIRPTDHEKKNKQLIVKQGQIFDEAAKVAKNKAMFKKAVRTYLKRHGVYFRGHVEFIYAAMNHMEQFDAHEDLETYKVLFEIFPKEKLIANTMWQTEFMHYPKQQHCAIDILEKMEDNAVIPDDDMGEIIATVFGTKAHCFRRYQRMMYWMPKFKHANPYPVPRKLPSEPWELAVLALKRMAVDIENKVTVAQADELETAQDPTFVAYAHSPLQSDLILRHPVEEPVFVEGGFNVWMRQKCLTYFVLKSEAIVNPISHLEQMKIEENAKDENLFEWNVPFFSESSGADGGVITLKPIVHEQEDGSILSMCITGTGSKDSLRSWIHFLQKTNPKLAEVPVIFRLTTPESGLEPIDTEQNQLQHKS